MLSGKVFNFADSEGNYFAVMERTNNNIVIENPLKHIEGLNL